MAKRVSFSNKHLKIDDIVEYKEDLEQSLIFYYANAKDIGSLNLEKNMILMRSIIWHLK